MSILKENEIKSPYDLREMLWYVIPGATLLLLIFLFEYWFAVQIRGVEGYNKNDLPSNNEWIIKDPINEATKHRTEDKKSKVKIDTLNVNQTKYVDSRKTQDSLRKSYLDSVQKLSVMREDLLENLHTPIFTALSVTHAGDNILGENWAVAAVYLLLLLTVCYLLGHISYIIGTFVYERGYISKGFCYPYLKLLSLPEDDHKNLIEIRASQGFYRGFYFWTAFIFIIMYVIFITKGYLDENYENYKNFLLLASLLLIIIPVRLKLILYYITEWYKDNNKHKKNRPQRSGIIYYSLLTIILIFLMYIFNIENQTTLSLTRLPAFLNNNYLYIIGTFIAVIFFIEVIIRHFFARRRWVSKIIRKRLLKSVHFGNIEINVEHPSTREKLFYESVFIKSYNFLGNQFDRFINDYFHIQKDFEPNFIEKYGKTFRKVYDSDYLSLTKQNYWLSKFFVMENSTYMNQQISFWENIYRFTKSLSASFLIACFYCTFSFMTQYREMRIIFEKTYDQWAVNHYVVTVLFLIPVTYFILTALCIQYYTYVYDNRYSRMVLRSFVSIVSSKEYNKK